MYHFIAEQIPELRLSAHLVSSRITQYLKPFQIEALRCLYEQLERHDFCILNDESGLGKSATIAALLSAIGVNKKTLIVVQNDEQLLAGWEFHFGILTELPVCVIQNSDDSTSSEHNVYLAKWSVLRSIGDLSKLKFDYVIIDHRGYMLNNNFCTSMLLKHFEKKVNIVISSVDITSDVKLLHNILRLVGRLEHQYKSFRTFEQKFRLPDAKEVFSKKIGLEEYYKQREILGDFVKDFRLRRYRHQYDQYLPLVTPEQYKTNLALWLAANHNSSNTLSSSGNSTHNSNVDLRSTAGTQEIIECLISIKKERQETQQNLAHLRECTEVLEPSEEPVAMSPLIFESSESELECEIVKTPAVEDVAAHNDIVQVSSDDCEIITPNRRKKQAKPTRNLQKQHHHNNGQVEEANGKIKKDTNVKLEKAQSNKKEKSAKVDAAQSNKKVKSAKVDEAQSTKKEKSAKLKDENVPQSNKKDKSVKLEKTQTKTNKTPEQKSPKEAAKELQEAATPAKRKKPSPKDSAKSRELQIAPSGIHNRVTRAMQRITRSTDQRLHSKYMTTALALDIDKKREKRRKQNSTPTCIKMEQSPSTRKSVKIATDAQKTSPKNANKKKPEIVAKQTTTPHTKETIKTAPVLDAKTPKRGRPRIVRPTQLLSASSSVSDYEEIQCAQRLPPDLERICDVVPRFRIPVTPNTTPPTQFNLPNESDISLLAETCKQNEIVVLSSSQDEDNTKAEQAQSRRTRALKHKRSQQTRNPVSNAAAQHKRGSFGELLAKQTQTQTQTEAHLTNGMHYNKSPDLFSNCSDILTLPFSQQLPERATSPATTFEGFKIFGSEVKQFQQQHAKQQQQQQPPAHVDSGERAVLLQTQPKKKSERSCLDILERMFETRGNKKTQNKSQVMPTYPIELSDTVPPTPDTVMRPFITQPRRTILEDEDIFEITNNTEFGNRLRLNSGGDVSPILQQQHPSKSMQPNKITNYLIGSNNTPTIEEDAARSGATTPSQRKSPKSSKSTQVTKLTRWFAAANGGAGSAPTTPAHKSEIMHSARHRGPMKRKRLELFK